MRILLAHLLVLLLCFTCAAYQTLKSMHRLPFRALPSMRLPSKTLKSPIARLWSRAEGAEATDEAAKKLPVTVLSGFLGSGKTTMLRHILEGSHGKKFAVLVNDMSELNIDKELITNSVMGTEQQLIEMSNGCLCCTLRDDLLKDVVNVARQRKFDHLLIETTGVAEPWPVAATLTHAQADGVRLQDISKVDTMVTVIDAFNFLRWFKEATDIKDLAPSLLRGEDDATTITDLLVNQIEFANLLVLNKKDLVSEEDLEKIGQILRSMNAHAEIIHAERGQVELGKLIGANLYELNEFSKSPRWRQLLAAEDKKVAAESAMHSEPEHSGGHAKAPSNESTQHHHHDHHHDHHHEPEGHHHGHNHGHQHHNHEHERHGITSFVFRDNRLLHPMRLMNFICNDMEGLEIVRSKGWFRTASNPAMPLVWSQAGALFNVEPDMINNSFEGLEDPNSSPTERAHAQEIVFIGPNINETRIREKLESCVLTEQEVAAGEEEWKKLENPWPFPDVPVVDSEP